MKKTLIAVAAVLSLILMPLLEVRVAQANMFSCIAEGEKDVLECAEESQQTDTATSFTQYTGGLQAPSAEGYATKLTEAQDVRTFVLNITNFALGFLGMLAVVIIIYGGFMYVTAAGKEDQAGKGKKAIVYAVIGILVIMGSYAIVNTVLQAPGGKETPTQGAAEGTEVIGGSVQRRFNILASRVETLTRNIVSAYLFHYEISTDLKTVQDAITAARTEVQACASSCPEHEGSSDWSAGILPELNSRYKSRMDNAITAMNNINNKIPASSSDSLIIKSAVDDYVVALNNHWNAAVAAARTEADATGCNDDVIAECEEGEYRGVFSVFLAVPTTDIDDKYAAAYRALAGNRGNFYSTVNNTKTSLKQIYDQVAPITDVADTALDALVDIDELKKDLALITRDSLDAAGGDLNDLKNALGLSDTPGLAAKSQAGDDALMTVVQDFTVLYNLLKDIQFVDARVTASVAEGNAPLVVSFSSVGSLDPSGLTITDERIEWDLDGDGDYSPGELTGQGGKEFMDCRQENRATVSCIYMQPGTYRVNLRISPSGEQNPATGKFFNQEIGKGIATITIKVNPPQTKIRLSMENYPEDGDSYYLMDYDKETGFLTVNRSGVTVLASRAATGITFKADETEGSDGKFIDQAGATIKWDFGDGSRDEFNNNILSATTGNMNPTHAYANEGIYTVTAEFTDKNKNIDRKIFTLAVSAVAPFMRITPDTVNVNDEVLFDGSGSASDNGPITNWDWKLSKPLPGLDPASLKKESFKYKFTGPGTYDVSLEITDSLGEPAKTSAETVMISSKPPVSQFTHSIPDKAQPGTVILDGTKSYDPDGLIGSAIAYQWEINGQKLASTADYEYTQGTNPNSAKATVKFKKTGDYAIMLTATDPGEPAKGQESPMEKTVNVESVLDIAWGANTNTSTVLKVTDAGTTSTPPVTLNLLSSTAVAYEVDFGDDTKEQGDMPLKTPITHNYKEAGTYVIKASVFDARDNENTLSRKAYVGSSSQPVAVISFKINGQDYVPIPGEAVTVNRKDVVTFDASQSKNVDGTGRRLNYSWDLGDGERSTKESVNHTYKDVGSYKVSLKATNANDVSQSGGDTFDLAVKGEAPTLRSVTAVPTGSSLTTPVTVALTAVGAEDPDGKITRYRWWYFDPANDQDEMGVQVTNSPNANIVIGTRGEEGQEKTYKFSVEMTDDENNTVGSREIISDNAAPSLTVTNGPNKSPVAKFNVDRTSIGVGESVEFSSSSTDADGQIVAYYWDWEGDGFANNNQSEGPTVTHVFNAAAKDGIRVRLKVVDNFESEAVSDAVTIYVEGKAQPPLAAFTSAQDGTTKKVKFTNNSASDTENGINLSKHVWDFNTALDSNGDGKKDNDTDSTEKEPSFEYPDYGIYRAKLIVTDSANATAEVTNFVNVKTPPKPVTETAPAVTVPVKPAAPTLDARLLTTPAFSFVDGKIHLTGESGDVTFDYSTSVGDIKKYVIDKNIYFDSNGNGNKMDDEDYTAAVPGKWTTNYAKSYGQIRARLTVTDSAGKTDYVEKDIVFDTTAGSTFLADVFSAGDMGLATMFICMSAFVIIYLKKLILFINKQK